MQTSRYLIGTFVELTSGMQYGHYNFQCGFLFLFVIVYRDTTSVVLYGDGVVLVNGDFDVVAIAGKCLVDGVVHNLVHQVVKSFAANVANIHRGTLSHCFQTFQYLDVFGRIAPVIGVNLFFSHNLFSLL